MKQSRRLSTAWQTLAIVFAMFLVMAFACEPDDPPPNNNPPPGNNRGRANNDQKEEATTDADVLTEEIAKKVLTTKITNAAPGSARSVTVNFESVRFAKPLKARFAEQYGDNHYEGATVYPVRWKAIVVYEYADRPDELKKFNNETDFYQNYYGEWDYQKGREVKE